MKALIALAFTLISANATMACPSVTVGDITLQNAWSRASLGTTRPGVVYVTIHNSGGSDDVLTGLSTPVSAMPMVHETVVTDGVASMPHVMAVTVPAGGTVALAPGGFHGMLMDLTIDLKKGDTFPVTLLFQRAGAVTISVEVLAIGAKGAECQ